MAVQTDVKSKYQAATAGAAAGIGGRIRVKSIYYVANTAGTITFKDGSSTGTSLIVVDVPAVANVGAQNVLIPGEGVLFQGDPYLVITGATSITFFYG